MTLWYQYPVTQSYGTNGEQGIDFGTPYNTPITALFGGTIVEAQRTDWGNGSSSGGIVTILSDIPGLGKRLTYYLHLDALNPGLQPGQTIAPGTLLGLSGGQTSGGNWPTSPQFSTGPHTEFGIDASFAGTGTNPSLNADPLSFLSSFGIGSGQTTPSYKIPSSTSGGSSTTTAGSTTPPTSPFGNINIFGQDFTGFFQQGLVILVGVIVLFIGIVVLFFGNKETRVNIEESAGKAAVAA